jgi:tRNA nucleotidyltransferase (CCA-adding enzyme)
LLHDIAKPECKSTVNGVIHFFSHEYRGATIATEILKRMKYSNLETKSIITAIKNHMRFKQSGNHCPSNKAIRKFVSEIGSDQLDIVLDVINADNNSHDEQFNYPDQTDLIRLKIAELSEKEKMTDKIILPINGNDIMEHFNMKKGPKIGEYLDLIKEKYLDNPSISKEECFEIIKGKLVY